MYWKHGLETGMCCYDNHGGGSLGGVWGQRSYVATDNATAGVGLCDRPAGRCQTSSEWRVKYCGVYRVKYCGVYRVKYCGVYRVKYYGM